MSLWGKIKGAFASYKKGTTVRDPEVAKITFKRGTHQFAAAAWNLLKFDRGEERKIRQASLLVEAGKEQYLGVARALGVPDEAWDWIGEAHYREASCNFKRHLHNGDPLTARTVQVPAGRPLVGKPPFTWVESAVDALRLKNIHLVTDWSVENRIVLHEIYNGMGHARNYPTEATPYVYACTNINDNTGTYIADGAYKADADTNGSVGTAAIMKDLESRGVCKYTRKWESPTPVSPVQEAPKPAPVVEKPVESVEKPTAVQDLPWVRVIYLHIQAGVGEIAGPKNHPIIEAAHKFAGLAGHGDNTAWCSSYMKYVFFIAGVPGGLLNGVHAWARDWMKWGSALTEFKPGCVMVFERNAPGGDSHVTCGIREEKKNGVDGYICAGGNQSNKVCEAWYPKSSRLAMRWPTLQMQAEMLKHLTSSLK